MKIKNLILSLILISTLFSCTKKEDKLIGDNSLLNYLPKSTYLYFNSKMDSKAYKSFEKSIWYQTDGFSSQLKQITKNRPAYTEVLEGISYLEETYLKFAKTAKLKEMVFFVNSMDNKEDKTKLDHEICYLSESDNKKNTDEAYKLLLAELDKNKSVSLTKEEIKFEGNCIGNKLVVNNKLNLQIARKNNHIYSCTKVVALNNICNEKDKGLFLKTLKEKEDFKKLNVKSAKILDGKILISNLFVDGVRASEVFKKTSTTKQASLADVFPIGKLVMARGVNETAKSMADAILVNIRNDIENGKNWIKILNSTKDNNSEFSVPKTSILNLLVNAKALSSIITGIASGIDTLKPEEKLALDKALELSKKLNTLGISLHPANGPFPIPGLIIKADGNNLKETYAMFLQGIKTGLNQQGLGSMGVWQKIKIADVDVEKFSSPFGIGVSFAFKDDSLFISSDDNLLKTAFTKENSTNLSLNNNQIQSFSLDFPEIVKLLKNVEAQLGMFTGGQPLFKDKEILNMLEQYGKMSQSLSFSDETLNVELNYSLKDDSKK